tara:strand:+ start:435 stop:851 length:417 start_codon:yes stop_codon:yes gene_type:complete
MKFDYSGLSDTTIGKFIGCAIMANKERLASIDMSNVDITVTVDGEEVDLQKVFTAFERTVIKPTSEAYVEEMNKRILLVEDKIRAMALSDQQSGRDQRASLLAIMHETMNSWSSSDGWGEVYELLHEARVVAQEAKVV